MGERWMNVSGYEGRYQVSNHGRVRSLPRWQRCGARMLRRGLIVLRPAPNITGCLFVNLHKNGAVRTHMVARLVAAAFVPNPDNKPRVRHLDNNHDNNQASNLVWATPQEISKNSPRVQALARARADNKRGGAHGPTRGRPGPVPVRQERTR